MSWEPPYEELLDEENDYQDFKVKILYDDPNKKSILITDDDARVIWIPRSLLKDLEYDEENYGFVTFSIPEWLAIEKGLI